MDANEPKVLDTEPRAPAPAIGDRVWYCNPIDAEERPAWVAAVLPVEAGPPLLHLAVVDRSGRNFARQRVRHATTAGDGEYWRLTRRPR